MTQPTPEPRNVHKKIQSHPEPNLEPTPEPLEHPRTSLEPAEEAAPNLYLGDDP